MDYEAMRHFADSWGLVFLLAVFVTAIGWLFRPGATYDDHARIPFRNDDDRGNDG